MKKIKAGFTLIELLIVIAIIGILASLMVTNFSGARARARDAKAKGELHAVRNGLALYHNVYNAYPVTAGGGTQFAACGPNGTSQCPVCSNANFAAGGADGCLNVFLQYYTKASATSNNPLFRYYSCPSGDDYRLKVTLENKSDSEITESQLKCPWSSCAPPLSAGSYGSADYVVCP